MTQKEEIAALKETIRHLEARIAALEARPVQPVMVYPAPAVQPWQQPLTTWETAGPTITIGVPSSDIQCG